MEPSLPLAVGVFVALIVCTEIGYRLGRAEESRHPAWGHEGLTAVEAALFGLLGLLLALSFAGGTERLGARYTLITEEARAISAANGRIDLLPADAQPAIRRLMRQYLEERINLAEGRHDQSAIDSSFDRAEHLELVMWDLAVAAIKQHPVPDVAAVVLPAFNEMRDAMAARRVAIRLRLPPVISGLLVFVALMTGIMAGYSMATRPRRNWLYTLFYAGAIAATIYVVLDLDRPRQGLIKVKGADEAMLRLRQTIK